MPKEFTHIHIAKSTLNNLTKDETKTIKKYDFMYYLGCVFHDSLYYYTGKDTAVQLIADKLHGANGEDTFEPINRILGDASLLSEDEEMAWKSFCSGMATHICVDVNFHPFIYYFTGDYYSDDSETRILAQKRHRQLESSLDVHLGVLGNKVFLSTYIKSFKDFLRKLPFQEIRLFSNDSLSFDAIIKSFENYSLAQNIYARSLPSKILRSLYQYLPISLKIISDLSYYNLPHDNKLEFGTRIGFKNPVSGCDLTFLTSESLASAVSDSTLLVEKILNQKMLTDFGPSLETGLAGVSASEMKFFHKHT